jgi:glycosyltransferase involved in cell wall biosynthesis
MTLVVHHFGPDRATVGGMASVIRVLTEHQVGGDTVDAHATWTPQSPVVSARLAAASAHALWRMPAGEVAHIHLSERGSFLREGSLVALARRRGLVTVATIHGASLMPFARRCPWLVAAVLRRTHLVTCMDQGVLELVRRSVPRVHSEIVPNPVFVDNSFLPADEADELVVFAGEIGMRKGADVLSRAWQLVAQRRPQARCLMVGPVADFKPPDAERLEVRAPVAPIEMTEILRGARVVVLPSRAEGMPMVLAEAMSLGRPFVSTPVGGIPELAAAGGMLVPIDDELALADRLTELLSNPDLACGIGERGRRFCIQTRSVEVIDTRLRQLYAAAAAESDQRAGDTDR